MPTDPYWIWIYGCCFFKHRNPLTLSAVKKMVRLSNFVRSNVCGFVVVVGVVVGFFECVNQ